VRKKILFVLLISAIPFSLSAQNYYTGNGGAGTNMLVREINASALAKDDQWLGAFIRSVLVAKFNMYSAIKAAETEAGLPGAATCILVGSITPAGASIYTLTIRIDDSKTGLILAPFSRQANKALFTSGKILNEASEELLKGMKVELTDVGAAEIKKTDTNDLKAKINLARGKAANNSGNTLETMIYLYNAVAFDASLLEADEILRTISADIRSGGLGQAIRDDIESRKNWEKILTDFEKFYTEHLPYEIIFTRKPVQHGTTNYEDATVNLQFELTLRKSEELEGMSRVLATILTGLDATKKREEWGFARWPYYISLFGAFKTYTVVAELVNDDGKVIDTMRFDMRGRLIALRKTVYADTEQNVVKVYTKVKADRQTLGDKPFVRIASINGIGSEESANRGFVKISAADELPSKYMQNIFIVATR
jgi:hypothetical protein